MGSLRDLTQGSRPHLCLHRHLWLLVLLRIISSRRLLHHDRHLRHMLLLILERWHHFQGLMVFYSKRRCSRIAHHTRSTTVLMGRLRLGCHHRIRDLRDPPWLVS